MDQLNPVLLSAGLLFAAPALGQTDTLTVREHTAAHWAAGTVTDLDATTDTLRLQPQRSFRYGFTNCGQTGINGPTQSQCNTAYGGSDLAGAVTVTAGIQQWVVPQTGTYRIRARGAGHGADTADYLRGAIIQAGIEFQQNDTLNVLVGQMGASARGGSGGTFIVRPDGAPVLVAGGAAGMRGRADAASRGQTNPSSSALACGAAGASGGDGGLLVGAGSCSGAGGGLLGNGQGCGGGFAFVNGGRGGSGSFNGGFGGGAGVNSSSSPGAGGGFSGGSAHYTGGTQSCAGGGASFAMADARGLATSDGLYDGSANFNGDAVGDLGGWHLGHGAVTIEADLYNTAGLRTSPEHDIASPGRPNFSSLVEWDALVFTGTTLTVEVRHSTDGGTNWSTWTPAVNGGPIPGLATGTDMSSARVQTRVAFTTTVPLSSAFLHSITITVVNGIPTGIADRGQGGLDRIHVFPNPFNDVVELRYGLERDARVGLRVLNLLGQPLLTIEEGMRPAGGHSRTIDLAALRLAPGMYWLEVLADGQATREKLVRR